MYEENAKLGTVPPRPPEKETQVQITLDSLGDIINELNLVLPKLFSRLDPVLIPRTPCEGEVTNKKVLEERPVAPIVKALKIYIKDINTAITETYNILDRLEL